MAKVTPATTGYVYTDNLCAPFFNNAEQDPEQVAVVFQGTSYRNADIVAKVDAAIDLLLNLGIGRGDRVAFLGENQPGMLVLLYALSRLGAVYLPLNPRSAGEEVLFIAEDADIKAIVVGSAFQDQVEAVRPQLAGRTLIGIDSAPAHWTTLSLHKVVGTDGRSRHGIVSTHAGDTAFMLYTSGTTGTPKGVVYTHGNVWATVCNLLLANRPNASSTTLAVAPMFHIASLAYALTDIAAGGRVVMLPSFDVDAVYHSLAEWKVTTVFAVPTMLIALEQHPLFATHDFTGLTIIAAGGPVPVPMLRKWLGRGALVTQGYGMTEGSGTVLPASKALAKVGSAGRALPLTEVQIRDVESNEVICDSGVNGQIFMRGPSISKGYWRRPEETAKVFADDGWLATGDIGRWDEDGYIYIVDRLKDMIVSGGMNVYPAEIEKVLSGHAQVRSVAVIGLPDSKWGERVTAIVVPHDLEQADPQGLEAFSREKMSNYKIPKQFEFVEVLPIGPSGKVLKRELRKRFANTAEASS
ncbi:MAG: AMP-binding protein [Pseudomonadota bacterium]